MLKFKITTIIFVLLLAVLIVLNCFYSVPILSYLLLFTCYLLCLVYGSYNIDSNFYMPVICKAKTNDKKIAISFDDGPANFSLSLLEILEAHNIKATFFCIGKQAAQDNDTLRGIFHAGHIIGNHSYSHNVPFTFWSTKKVKRDLQKTNELIKNIIGKNLLWFRPPFGVTNPNIAKAASSVGYTTIGWSIRSLDTIAKNKETLLEKLKDKLHPGAIILFHDTCAITVEVLPEFITYAQKQGYKIVPMDKLLNLKPYAD